MRHLFSSDKTVMETMGRCGTFPHKAPRNHLGIRPCAPSKGRCASVANAQKHRLSKLQAPRQNALNTLLRNDLSTFSGSGTLTPDSPWYLPVAAIQAACPPPHPIGLTALLALSCLCGNSGPGGCKLGVEWVLARQNFGRVHDVSKPTRLLSNLILVLELAKQ